MQFFTKDLEVLYEYKKEPEKIEKRKNIVTSGHSVEVTALK